MMWQARQRLLPELLVRRKVGLNWLPGPPDALALQAAIGLALPRFGREQALQLTLQGAQARLDERKWVDRAKGILMRGQQLSEDDAFSLLRAASMQREERLGVRFLTRAARF